MNQMNMRIKKLREELNLTQAEFSLSLGLSATSASSWEKKVNPQMPTESMKLLICKIYNVNYNWLVNGEGEMFNREEKSLIERLAEEYNMTILEKKLLEAYLGLSEDNRREVERFIKDIVEDSQELELRNEALSCESSETQEEA